MPVEVLVKFGYSRSWDIENCYKKSESLQTQTYFICLRGTNTFPNRERPRPRSIPSPADEDIPQEHAWRWVNLTAVLRLPGQLPPAVPSLAPRPHLGTTVWTVSLVTHFWSLTISSCHHHTLTPPSLVALEDFYGWDQPKVGIWDCCTNIFLSINVSEIVLVCKRNPQSRQNFNDV